LLLSGLAQNKNQCMKVYTKHGTQYMVRILPIGLMATFLIGAAMVVAVILYLPKVLSGADWR